jgi:hypothetical protein
MERKMSEDFRCSGAGFDTKEHIWSKQLYHEFEDICYQYRLKLLRPLIIIDNAKGRWGMWDSVTRVLSISRHLIENFSWDAVINVLKHEMAHMLVNEHFKVQSWYHDATFHKACDIVGIAHWACASEEDMAQSYSLHSSGSLNEREERLSQKVKKLLALATSPNEHEALLAVQRVKEIYQRHQMELLQNGERRSHVYIIINHKQKRIAQFQSMITSILTSHFSVRVIYSSQYDARINTHYKTIEILGTRENVTIAEYVYYFLYNNLPLLWANYAKKGARTIKARNSYYLGVLTGFRNQLQEGASPAAASFSSLPVAPTAATTAMVELSNFLKQASRELDSYVAYRHPRLGSRKWSGSYTDSRTFQAGVREGRGLSLNKGIVTTGGVPRLPAGR